VERARGVSERSSVGEGRESAEEVEIHDSDSTMNLRESSVVVNRGRAQLRSILHTTLHEQSRLGIDIGRVIVGAADENGHADTSFLSGSETAALETPPVEGAFETIASLHAQLEGRVWLVSKCGPRIQALTRRWLAHHGFHEKTGLSPEHLRFCRERREKRDHAARLGLTHFIDDRVDVLSHLVGLVPSLYLFGHQKSAPPEWVVHVRTWRNVKRLLLPNARDHQVLDGHGVDQPDGRSGNA
jgi:hypothetical protein